jgi:hypothetical protein
MGKLIFIIALAACFTGCASRHPKIFAHRDPAHWPSVTNRIAIAAHQQSRPQDAELGDALRAELRRRGFNLTAATNADYVLAYWVEENWNTMRPGGSVAYGGPATPVGMVPYEGSPITAPGSLSMGISPDGRLERYLLNEGIRLELYPQLKSAGADLTAAWTGSIAGSSELRPAQIPALLSALLNHFGEDFIGRVKLHD